jgi:hypothetical protein
MDENIIVHTAYTKFNRNSLGSFGDETFELPHKYVDFTPFLQARNKTEPLHYTSTQCFVTTPQGLLEWNARVYFSARKARD